jgi:RHS repeat-associated protein
VAALDFKGNLLDKSRRVIADAPMLAVFDQAQANGWQVTPFQVDWRPAPQQTLADREGELLETTAYQTTATYDALNRVKRMRFPHDVEARRRELRPEYNRAGGLDQVWLDDTLYVERIAYDAKGQRALIAYGNGVMTRYAYDPQTFRLKRLRSERYTKPDTVTYHPTGDALQDYGYDYDLVGNILGIHDRTPGSGILNNPEALNAGDVALAQLLVGGDALDRRFDYDPIYRLVSANGRECDLPSDGPPWADQPRCTDLTRTRAYTERYAYDPVGNLLRLEHRNDNGGFTRELTTETANNRLQEMKIGQTLYAYTFDANGNLRSETTSRHFEWNHADQMKAFRTQIDSAEPSVYAHYLYDAAGQRVKKLVRKQGGQIEVTHYVDAVFEHHRWGSGAQAGENNHLHVMDDQQRIALVRFGNAHPQDTGPAVQFHLGDHLGSATVVVDSGGALVNREEFTPYGETSFGSFARKRYRFTGKERDEESGLNYHSARYFSLSTYRWLTCDPLMASPSRSPYEYASSCPTSLVDPDGTDDKAPDIVEDYPIHPGIKNDLTRSIDREDTSVGDQGPHYTYHDTSFRTLNRSGLKSYLTERVHGALTSFEEGLVNTWNPGSDSVLTPLYQVGIGGGLVGYRLDTGSSGDKLHTLYNRSGDILLQTHSEQALVPKNWVLLGLAAPIGRFAVSRLAGGTATPELVHYTGVEGGAAIRSSGQLMGSRGIFAVRGTAKLELEAGELEVGFRGVLNKGAQFLGKSMRVARTGLMPGSVGDAVAIPDTATGLFSRILPIGPYSALKALGGVRFAPPGALSLATEASWPYAVTGAFTAGGSALWPYALIYGPDVLVYGASAGIYGGARYLSRDRVQKSD